MYLHFQAIRTAQENKCLMTKNETHIILRKIQRLIPYSLLMSLFTIAACQEKNNNTGSTTIEHVGDLPQASNKIIGDTSAGPSYPKKASANDDPQNCMNIVMDILTSAEAYQTKTKNLEAAAKQNGGTSYGITLEGSPHPQEDEALAYSATYDFSIHENYPDHMPVIARYCFNPQERQLYEYDIAEDKLIPILFDKSLLAKMEAICR